ncbi:retropepsin-like aspartic protease [Pseudomonas sp. H1_F01]
MRPRAVIDDNVVRIKFLNGNGTLSDSPEELEKVPVIEVLMEQAGPDGNIIQAGRTMALVDTGADHFAMDRSFAERCGFIPAGTTSPSGVGGFVENANYYDLTWRVTTNGGEKIFRSRFVAVPLKETGREYQAIFGMTFVHKGRLLMDSKTSEYIFEFN